VGGSFYLLRIRMTATAAKIMANPAEMRVQNWDNLHSPKQVGAAEAR
jgi:hypothetical protein